MAKGKYANNRKRSMKPIVMLLAVALLVGSAIGGTIAWLTDSTDQVTNTFTVGDIGITLKESPISIDKKGNVSYGTPEENVTNQYPMIPGTTYKKDPVVAVDEGSEDCWLFVKFVKGPETDKYITYNPNWTGWTKGEGGEGQIPANVWYRHVGKNDTTKSWELLSDNTIAIKSDTVTKQTMSDAVTNSSLNYIAYAIQSANIGSGTDVQKATAAWAELSKAAGSGSSGSSNS